MSVRSDIVLVARSWIGTPYLHQCSTKGAGTDCLGLLRGVWREVIGAEPQAVPAYSSDWSEAAGQEVLYQAGMRWMLPKALTDEAEGDVLLFRMRDGAIAKHLGFVGRIGPNASFVHAYTGHGVIETALSEPWRRKIVARFQFPEGA